MAREEKKKKNRLRYMISSVIIAIIAWSVVTYATDPDITKRINGIRIELTGEDLLAERGFVITNRDEIPKTSVTMRGKRSDLIKAIDTAKLVVDVSQITKTGDFSVEGNVKLPSSRITVERVSLQNVAVSVAKLQTREIPVRITQTGELEGKLVKSEAETQTVLVKGSAEELDMIDAAEVVVDVSTVEDSKSISLGYSLMLKDGVDRDALSTIKMSDNVVSVKNTVYDAKEVPVRVVVRNSQSILLNAEETIVEPEKITVGVKDGVSVNEITVTIDENAPEGEYKVDKPDNVYIPPHSKSVTIEPVWEEIE